MLKIGPKAWIKRIFSLIFGVVLCIYILIPLFSALLLRSIFLVPKEYVFLAFSIFGAMAFAASGFLMSFIISYFSINKEIRTTLFGVLMVTILLVVNFFAFYSVPPQINQKNYLLKVALDITMNVVCLLVFAVIGAWLIARKRLSKAQNH